MPYILLFPSTQSTATTTRTNLCAQNRFVIFNSVVFPDPTLPPERERISYNQSKTLLPISMFLAQVLHSFSHRVASSLPAILTVPAVLVVYSTGHLAVLQWNSHAPKTPKVLPKLWQRCIISSPSLLYFNLQFSESWKAKGCPNE